MSVWMKEKSPNVGAVHISWRTRSVSRMFIKILTWFLLAFVLALLAASVIAPFDPLGKAHSYIQLGFILFFLYGIVSSFVGYVYLGQQFAIAEKAVVSYQPLWKGGLLMAWLRKRWGKADQYVEFLPWKDIAKIVKSDKDLTLLLKDGMDFAIPVLPVLEFKRKAEGDKPFTREIAGFWARISKTDKVLNEYALQRIVERAHWFTGTLRTEKASKRRRR